MRDSSRRVGEIEREGNIMKETEKYVQDETPMQRNANGCRRAYAQF
jgi:hypothetical protein